MMDSIEGLHFLFSIQVKSKIVSLLHPSGEHLDCIADTKSVKGSIFWLVA
jgi:hypothetical protein